MKMRGEAAPGPDGIRPAFLQQTKEEIAGHQRIGEQQTLHPYIRKERRRKQEITDRWL